ncbi:MAG: glycosyltransferase family 4 protein [Myxococcales bacterium]|nr:glycosyltransferase family 4 protein [Myxococcales bacterium]
MRIGLLTTSFPRYDDDVAGCFVLRHARELAARGHEVEVLAPEPPRGAPPPTHAGVRVTWVPYLRPRALQRTFYGAGAPDNLRADALAWLGPLPFAANLLATARGRGAAWDALVSHWALPCALTAGLVRGDRPHTAVLHSADIHLLSRLPGGARLARAVARGASELRFVSEHGRRTFMGLLPPGARQATAACARVEPMPIDAPRPPQGSRHELRRSLGLTRFTLLFLGRLVPIKGLAEAIGALHDRADLELLVAGDGPERPHLERLARGVPLHVRFLGTVVGSRKEALLHAADALLMPSRPEPDGRTEGAPLVVREAVARGLPVIAARTGGIPELLDAQSSPLLFDPHRPGSLDASIARLQHGAASV